MPKNLNVTMSVYDLIPSNIGDYRLGVAVVAFEHAVRVLDEAGCQDVALQLIRGSYSYKNANGVTEYLSLKEALYLLETIILQDVDETETRPV